MTPTSPNAIPHLHGTGFYVWQVPGIAVSVHLHLAVIDRLSEERPFTESDPPRAACGLLLGWTVSESQVVVVEDSVPLSFEGSEAPSTWFLGPGRAVFEEKLSQWSAGEDKRLWAVGYYQRQVDGELKLSDDDHALFTKFFPPPANVMLLATGGEGAGAVGGFFVWEGADVQRTTLLPFPLSRQGVRPSMETGSSQDQVIELGRRADAGRSPDRQKVIRWTAIGIAVATLAAIGIWELPQLKTLSLSPPSSAESPESDLQLRLDGTPRRVLLTWNRKSAVIAQSAKASITVNDGESLEVLRLERGELASGSLVYFPNAANVKFRLDVTTRDQRVVSESVRLLAARERAGEGEKDTRSLADREATPPVPPAPQPAPTAKREVRIRIEVDESGAVRSATPEPGQDSIPGDVMSRAVAEVKKGRYPPVTIDGKRVGSQAVIRFQVPFEGGH
jgi:proteasome lid subunit RPN8/RPN11